MDASKKQVSENFHFDKLKDSKEKFERNWLRLLKKATWNGEAR